MPRQTRGSLALEVKLTEPELKDAGKRLADAIQKKSEVESRVESFKAQAKGEIAEIEATIQKMSALVNNEKEFRIVDVDIVWDFKAAGTKNFVRRDTGEIVRTDRITDEERQQEFEDGGSTARRSPAPAKK